MKAIVNTENVLYGAAVIIENTEGKILLGKRYDTIGGGTWAAPVGQIEDGESARQAVVREVKEETGMTVCNPRHFISSIDDAYGHRFVISAFIATRFDGQPKVVPGEKHSEWRWFRLNELPKEEDMFVPALSILEAYKEYRMYREMG